MLLDEYRQQIKVALEKHNHAGLYFIIDSASLPELPERIWELEDNPQCDSLFRGTPEEELCDVAPYLIKVSINTRLFDWLLQQSAELPIGIFIISHCEHVQLYSHFKAALEINLPNHHWAHFKLYDPRVIAGLNAVCNKQAFASLLGPASGCIYVDLCSRQVCHIENEQSSCYHYENKKLTFTLTACQLERLVELSMPFAVVDYLRLQHAELITSDVYAELLLFAKQNLKQHKELSGIVAKEKQPVLGNLCRLLSPVTQEYSIIESALDKAQMATYISAGEMTNLLQHYRAQKICA
ncbi:DUF4123 domain-containing protein [Endozoicomonas sp. SM1973]|uniref:DUF4123 domain-containing protein n=1 Tax=Spartinivicinus marinus TaxID=2994442 RepID=A0A853IAZ0_9GAMM|nr:DUF4123 domain-containing protein [Spartinivicinus marinus]MCX4027005.1 DUF4123 domain-containing protein [Spartinivicinus marinus]NYZ67001.1 DUF4123 domain-containing protein [Spartinivicinus marinus]